MNGPAPTRASTMIMVLGGIASLCGILIVTTYQLTFSAIEKNKEEALRKAVFQVIPAARSIRTFVEGASGELRELTDKSHKGEFRYFAGYDESDALAGVALEARGQGFQDIISILYGYSPARNAVIGMAVLESKETPGLGDKIEKDPGFLRNFSKLDVRLREDLSGLLHPIEVVKKGKKTEDWQIDAITGATISSKAIGRILNESTDTRLPTLKKGIEALTGAEKRGPR